VTAAHVDAAGGNMTQITVPSDRVFDVLQNNILVDGFHIVIDLEKSHGCVMVDALEGKEYLDCYTYFATLPIGHNHPKMQDEGFRQSLMTAALSNPANSDVYSREFAGFVDTFREIAVPDEFRYLFFVAGGALAVENAMKAAFDWKAQKNRAKGIDGGGDKILHFREAFHGRSGYTLSVTNTEPTKTRDFPKLDWPRVSNPKVHFPLDDEAVAGAEDLAVNEIGDNHFRAEFFQKLRDLADKHEALLIFDEVQTGMGVTGKMWAYQHSGVTPDLISFGKKTQVCGVMSTTRIDEVEGNVFHVSSRINSTWGGNLVDMVRGARYLQIIREEGLVENAARVGQVFKQALEDLQADFRQVSNVRGRGLFLAFDLPDRDVRDQVRQACWDAGFATLPCGPRSIRFRPSLTFSVADVEKGVGILRGVLGK
jgi:L-lysine 6-transaminase